MRAEEIKAIAQKQRKFFATGKTLDVAFRMTALKKLKKSILRHEREICQALVQDLGKSPSESYLCEIGMVLSELSHMLRHTSKYAAPRRVRTPMAQFAASSFVQPSPYGVVLIMSPWNYPFMLTMDPLIDALAAGNTAVVKPSAYSPHTSQVIQTILEDCFPPAYVAMVSGGRAENQYLLEEPFDYIFFTGSQAVGKEVMRHAAEHLTPVTLELGGKSPCIVDQTADLRLAAKRIVFGKFLNCGQTCVAPDYIYCHESVAKDLVYEIRRQICRQFGHEPLQNPNYGKIINKKHFHRLSALIPYSRVIWGGKLDPKTERIEPTVVYPAFWQDDVMQEEIFGPILPILTFRTMEEAIEKINSLPHPLALYCFTQNKETAKLIMKHCLFGGGCINDTIIHLATAEMGFGGVGASGMGAYHGKTGFDTFSHHKSIVDKKTWIDLPMRYQPYQPYSDALVRLFLK